MYIGDVLVGWWLVVVLLVVLGFVFVGIFVVVFFFMFLWFVGDILELFFRVIFEEFVELDVIFWF